MKRLFLILLMLVSISSFASIQYLEWDKSLHEVHKPLTPTVYYLHVDYVDAQHTSYGYPVLMFYVYATENVSTPWRAEIVVQAYFRSRSTGWPPVWQWGWGTIIYDVDIPANTYGITTDQVLYNGEQFHIDSDGYSLDPNSYYLYRFYQL